MITPDPRPECAAQWCRKPVNSPGGQLCREHVGDEIDRRFGVDPDAEREVSRPMNAKLDQQRTRPMQTNTPTTPNLRAALEWLHSRQQRCDDCERPALFRGETDRGRAYWFCAECNEPGTLRLPAADAIEAAERALAAPPVEVTFKFHEHNDTKAGMWSFCPGDGNPIVGCHVDFEPVARRLCEALGARVVRK